MRNEIVLEAFRRGLLLIPCGENSLRMTPPLNIPRQLVVEGLEIFGDILAEVEPRYL